MLNILKYGDFTPLGKQKKKHQVILSHTSRPLDEYLHSITYRHNGKFPRIPNYVISREGKILQLLDNIEHTKFFTEPNINRNSIIVVLENLGWLQKEPLKDYYVNWNGDIYNGIVYEKKWRDYFFWHPYTTSQLNSTVDLCIKITKEMSIKKSFVGHNTRINGIEKYEGIVTKSNFDSNVTDLSPSFEFETFLKKIEYEQQT